MRKIARLQNLGASKYDDPITFVFMNSKDEKIAQFDPNGLAAPGVLYGLPFDEADAEVVVFPVPWEVTVSYSSGTASGPAAVLEASAQVDLYDPRTPEAWKMGLWMAPLSLKWHEKSDRNRERAVEYLEMLGQDSVGKRGAKLLAKVNEACEEMIEWVEISTEAYLTAGKLVALLGGDHSTPLGYLRALGKKHGSFGVLQIDAHMDLRKAYEEFTYSHASIMYNALQTGFISHLVQVGIRDYCQEEVDFAASDSRVVVHYDRDMKQASYSGETWAQRVAKIVADLPEKVYLSFDIDGLDPKLCPNTGTPVAGGLEAEQVLFLVEAVIDSGRTIIGLDLNEVAPGSEGDWDANVGARMLYRLCNLLGESNGRLRTFAS
jgi:agmatinase